MPAQQAEPPKLGDQGEQKPRESRVLTGPEAAGRGAIKSGSHRGSGTRWRPRLCSRSWVSKAPRGALAFPLLPLPRTGAPSSCLVVRASQDGWRRLGNSGGQQTSLTTPKESHDRNHCWEGTWGSQKWQASGARREVGEGAEVGNACSEVQKGKMIHHRVYMHLSLGQCPSEGKAMNGCFELRKSMHVCLSFFPLSLSPPHCPPFLYSPYHLFCLPLLYKPQYPHL